MMNVVRVAALVVALATVTFSSGAVAQKTDIDCDDFVIPQMAQAELDKDPSDPYGLDPDGDGLACEDLRASGAADAGVALDVNDAEEARLPLDARLGGTLKSWEAEFGLPVERSGEFADLFTEYDIPDLGIVYADEYLGRIESITVFAPRPEGGSGPTIRTR
jgi:hypothetical protein